MPATLYSNARLLDPWTHLDQTGDLLAVDGRIAAIGTIPAKLIPDQAIRVDCRGNCLAPGLVDLRVHLREPGQEHVETLEVTSRAAVAGGVTTLVGLPDTSPVIDDISLVEFVTRRARKAGLVNTYTYAAATKGLEGKALAELGLMAAAGALGFTDAAPVADSLVMRRLLSYARTFDQLIVQRPEDPRLAEGGAATEGEIASRLGIPAVPAAAELILLERDLRLVELTGGRYHASLISTAAAVHAIAAAKTRGLPVTCDTAPPYFTLNESAIDGYSTDARLSPPLRSEADRQAIVEGLKNGTIDAITSDHAPVDQDEKRVPFIAATPGAIGLETLLPLVLGLYHRGEMSLLAALRAVTQAPAQILRLPVGRLAIDSAADLILFDLDKPWRIERAKLRSTATNTPFDGAPVQGKVLKTFVAGRLVYGFDA
jgi:dihydroorotase